MHPYISENLAASHRNDLLAAADRHRQAVHARRNQARTPSRRAAVASIVASAVAAVARAATTRSSRPPTSQRPSDGVRPAPAAECANRLSAGSRPEVVGVRPDPNMMREPPRGCAASAGSHPPLEPSHFTKGAVL